MMIVSAISLSPAAQNWLQRPSAASILHLFENACNLINARGEILSLVTEQIGPGPFAAVLRLHAPLTELFSTDSPVAVQGSSIALGAATVDTAGARLWQPRPDWAGLLRRNQWGGSFYKLLADAQPAEDDPQSSVGQAVREKLQSGAGRLLPAIASLDLQGCRDAAAELAGVGTGLTPSGDDFLMGIIFALWATRPIGQAGLLIQEIVSAAVPRTTSLSAAWLKSAARGEAVLPWHELVSGLAAPDLAASERAIRRILSIGHSSGAEALAGFSAGLETLKA